MRLLVTDTAAQSPRQATAWLIMTLGIQKMNELPIGIITGILTTMILFLVNRAFHGMVAPWYRGFVYRGVDLNGEWTAIKKDEKGTSITWKASIRQQAHDVKADMVIIKKKTDGTEEISQLNMKGELWEGFLNATLRSKDRTRLSFASMLCKVSKGGRILIGQYTYRNLYNDEIGVLAVEFKKEEGA